MARVPAIVIFKQVSLNGCGNARMLDNFGQTSGDRICGRRFATRRLGGTWGRAHGFLLTPH